MDSRACRKLNLLLTAAFSAYPLGAWLLLYALAFRAYLHLGQWPQPYQPDPKTLPFEFHYSIVAINIFMFPVISVICLAWIVAARVHWKDYPFWKLVGWLAICVCGAVLLFKMDPGEFTEWFFD